jgi:hypothetical protein
MASPSTRGPLLLVLCVAQLMVILDISAVNVALPDMAADLGIGHSDVGWTITSYSLVFGSLLLLGGRAADLLGPRRMFLGGLSLFTVASLASALAGDATTLFAARAGQGLGAALLSPAALSIITSAFHGRDRAHALAVWGAVGGAGAAIGVLLGGTLTELVGWRAIFAINLPIGLVLAAAATKIVSADTARPRWRGLDLRGALVATGLAFLPLAIALAAGVNFASRLIDRAGVRSPLAGGFVVTAAGMVLLSGVSSGGSYVSDLLPGMLVAGLGLGVIAVSVSVAVLTGAGHEESGMLSGLNTTGHEIGGSLGVAVLATIATAASGGAAGPMAAAALADGIGDAFLVAAGIAAVSAVFAAVVLPPASSFLPKLRLAPRVALH